MNYAFKMMAVVLALGMMVLQGCQTGNYSNYADSFKNRAVGKSGTLAIQNYFARNKTYTSKTQSQNDFARNKTYASKTQSQNDLKRISRDKYGRYDKEGDKIINLDKKSLMKLACQNGNWVSKNYRYVIEAKKRTFECVVDGVASSFSVLNNANHKSVINTMKKIETTSRLLIQNERNASFSDYSSNEICKISMHNPLFKEEAMRRGLDCGVETVGKNVVVSKLKSSTPSSNISFVSTDRRFSLKFNVENEIINLKPLTKDTTSKYAKYYQMILDNVVLKNKQFQYAIKLTNNKKDNSKHSFNWINANFELDDDNSIIIKDNRFKKILNSYKDDKYMLFVVSYGAWYGNTFMWGNTSEKQMLIAQLDSEDNKTYYKQKPNISSAELESERQKRKKLEQELAQIKNEQKQEQQRIDTDNQEPIINAFTKQDGSNAIISGRVTDNTEVAEVLIDGEQLSLTNNGTFKTELYIPRNGLNVEIVAYDRKGNKATKLLKIERGNIQQASGPKFNALNPSGKRVKPNPNALALIIGVANYEKTSANALYADKDAQQFYDYATMKLGISQSNIKELVNEKADRVEITLAVKDWISRSTKSGKTDIYVFFAGHGLATSDGKDMFLLPYDGLPRLLQDSAIKRDQLFADIQKANPKSVTVFLDTCYSGTTRGTDMLIASRPIAIRALEQSIPNNFTVFSAAAGDQTSKPLEEAKHGMFSYFLMKGMEGDADTNNDNKITARELHAYVEQNVVQQSSGSQTPELQGDKGRVLVQFN